MYSIVYYNIIYNSLKFKIIEMFNKRGLLNKLWYVEWLSDIWLLNYIFRIYGMIGCMFYYRILSCKKVGYKNMYWGFIG